MSGKDTILVYDIGTTGLKCVAFSVDGEELRSATSAYRTFYPEVGRAEQDAEDFWTAAVEATGLVLADGAVLPSRIPAIGLSGHMNGCLPVDAQGQPLCREIIHSDSRSVAECADILRTAPHQDIYALTGNRVDEHLSLPKILWIRKNLPDLYRNTTPQFERLAAGPTHRHAGPDRFFRRIPRQCDGPARGDLGEGPVAGYRP